MIDAATKQPIRVLTAGEAGTYIRVSTAQLDKVRGVLEANHVPFWVDRFAVSIDGQPLMTSLYLRAGTDPQRVQALLDSAAE